jgi:polysaccharide export outer membrane protein
MEHSMMIRPLVYLLCALSIFEPFGLAIAADVKSINVDQNAYRLHEGDSIMISVWKEVALQKQVVVLPDGSITFPLIGRVKVTGLTSPEVEQLVTQKLKEYIPDPVVTAMVVGIDGNRAYVIGKVMHPGTIIINGPISVIQAISIVGGFDKFANESDIKVIRKADAGNMQVYPIHYHDIISGTDISTNIYLQAGDTIVVP